MPITPEERDRLIQRYAEGPAKLRAALAGAAEATPPPGIRYRVAEEKPVILGVDPDNWAAAFDYHAHPLEAALATVDAVRANTVPLLHRLPDNAWDKEPTHTETGRSTG